MLTLCNEQAVAKDSLRTMALLTMSWVTHGYSFLYEESMGAFL